MRDIRYEPVQTDGDKTDAIWKGVDQSKTVIQSKNSGVGYNFMQKSIITFILIKIYFSLSIGLTFYQRRILSVSFYFHDICII